MSQRILVLAVGGLLAVGCNDSAVQVYNTPPVASIIRPLDGDSFAAGDVVEVEAIAEDGQDEPQELAAYWASSLDGDLGEDHPDTNGALYIALSELTAGVQAITLTVVDTDGESASESVSINVGGDAGGGAPTVIWVGPADGSEVPGAEPLTVVGTVTDDEQPWETIDVTVASSLDGNLWIGNPATTGTVTADLGALTVGSHVLTMVAEDEDGHVATASANVTVLADGRPEVEITSPSSGDLFWTTDTISFQGTVTDDLTEPDRLHVQWQSDIDGVLLIGSPDSSGFTAAGRQLSEGTHTVTLTAIDEEANDGSDSIVVVVQDPRNVDDDGDGYTENEGDCDDGDASRSPGEPEVCDEVDNNCDGRVNESDEDSYEPDDSVDAAYDLGVVDGEILWTGSSISLSGLTLHGPDDEDWFTWDAADEFLLDNVDIQVRATGLPSSGNFTLQLWMWDGSTWVMKDSDSGYGALTVTATGDLLDDSEDIWAIAFFANTWPTGSCAQVYEIQIES